MNTQLQLFSRLNRIEQDLEAQDATKKQIAYFEERRSIIKNILDLSIFDIPSNCISSNQFLEKQKKSLIDLLNDFKRFPHVLIRTLVDDFGTELKQQIIESQTIMSAYLCKAITFENVELKLANVIKNQNSTLAKIESDTSKGKVPNYEKLLISWMMIIDVQNDAIEIKGGLDKCAELVREAKQRANLENSNYKLVRYGQEYTSLRDCIITSCEDELLINIKQWQSIYDRLEVYLTHLRGVIEFADVQYSKGIQDETALLNRFFLVGVIAQLLGMFSLTIGNITQNLHDGLLLIGFSVIPTMIIYFLIRYLVDLANQKKRNRLFKTEELNISIIRSGKNAE